MASGPVKLNVAISELRWNSDYDWVVQVALAVLEYKYLRGEDTEDARQAVQGVLNVLGASRSSGAGDATDSLVNAVKHAWGVVWNSRVSRPLVAHPTALARRT